MQEDRSCDHINLTTHRLFGVAAFAERTFCFGRTQTLIAEFERQIERFRYANCLFFDTLRLRAFFAIQGQRQARKEQFWLPIFDHTTKRRSVRKYLLSRKHANGTRDTPLGIAYRDTATRFPDIERHDPHAIT